MSASRGFGKSMKVFNVDSLECPIYNTVRCAVYICTLQILYYVLDILTQQIKKITFKVSGIYIKHLNDVIA